MSTGSIMTILHSLQRTLPLLRVRPMLVIAGRRLHSLLCAEGAFTREGVFVSDDMEVSDSLPYKLIGSETILPKQIAVYGTVAQGVHVEKLFDLATLPVSVAFPSYTSDAFQSLLLDLWFSVVIYRRPMVAHSGMLSRAT